MNAGEEQPLEQQQQQQQNKQAGSVGLVLWVIWGGLMGAVVIYAALVYSGVAKPAPAGAQPPAGLVPLLGLVAFACLAVSFAVRFLFTRRLAGHEDPAKRLMVLPTCIVSWALAESVAIFGLVLSFQGAARPVSGAFFLASLGAMLVLAPVFTFRDEVIPRADKWK